MKKIDVIWQAWKRIELLIEQKREWTLDFKWRKLAPILLNEKLILSLTTIIIILQSQDMPLEEFCSYLFLRRRVITSKVSVLGERSYVVKVGTWQFEIFSITFASGEVQGSSNIEWIFGFIFCQRFNDPDM